MAREFKRKCNRCDKTWYTEVHEGDKLKDSINLVSAQISKGTRILELLGGDRVSSNIALIAKDTAEQRLAQLEKCPNCQSGDYKEEIVLSSGDNEALEKHQQAISEYEATFNKENELKAKYNKIIQRIGLFKSLKIFLGVVFGILFFIGLQSNNVILIMSSLILGICTVGVIHFVSGMFELKKKNIEKKFNLILEPNAKKIAEIENELVKRKLI